MKRFAKYLSFQITAALIPSLVLLFSVPVLANRLNTETFAGFSVVISIIGFLSVLDGGIGRTATYFVKKSLLQGNHSLLNVMVSACLSISLILSVLVTSGMCFYLKKMDGASINVSSDALYTLLLFTPAIIAGSVMKGVLEGQQKFTISSCLQLIQGIVISGAPIIILNDINDLSEFSFSVGIVRTLTLLLQIYFSKVKFLASFNSLVLSVKEIFSYCKWLFVSNLIGLIIVYADRLFVVAKFDHADVSAYMLPMEIVSRSMIIVSALVTVIFPSLINSASYNRQETFIFVEGLKASLVELTLAISFLIFPFVDLMLAWWLGPEIVALSSKVVLVGLIGVAMATSSIISMMGINSFGQTRQIAILHLAELPLLLSLLYLATKIHSIWLVQTAWIIRLFIDMIGMNLIFANMNNLKVDSFKDISFKCKTIMSRKFSSTILISLCMVLLIGLSHLDVSSNRLSIGSLSIFIALVILFSAFKHMIQLKKLLATH